MSPGRLRAFAPFAAAAAVVGASWLLTSRIRAPAPDSAAAQPEVPPLDTKTRGWSSNELDHYRVKLTSVMRIGSGDAPAFDFDVMGRLDVEATHVTAETATLHGVLRDAKIVSRVPGSQESLDKIREELDARGFFFELGAGVLRELRVPKGASALAVNIYRTLAASLQVARSSTDAATYVAEEYDSTGKYAASYRKLDGVTLDKQKTRYLELLGPKAEGTASTLQVVPRVIRSESQIRLSPAGRPERVSAREEISLQGAQTPVASVTTLSLEPDGVETVAPPALDALYASMLVLKAADPYGKVAPDALDRSRIGTLTLDKIVTRLEELAQAKPPEPPAPGSAAAQVPPSTEESQLFIALGAIVRQEPANIPLIVQKIRAQSPASTVLLDALGMASSPESQKALVVLMSAKETSPALKARIAAALGRSAAPSDEAILALKGLLVDDPWSRKALFGLGTFSRKLRDAGDKTRAASLGDFLITKLDAAVSPASLITTLRAIANSGYTPALPKVIPYLTDSREQIRVDAVHALQSMQDRQVDNLIVARMHIDAANSVRISALETAQVRPPSDVLIRGVTAAAEGPDPHVRYRAVEVMLSWLSQRPELREKLERLATTDEEPRIRERIAGVLAAKSSTG